MSLLLILIILLVFSAAAGSTLADLAPASALAD